MQFDQAVPSIHGITPLELLCKHSPEKRDCHFLAKSDFVGAQNGIIDGNGMYPVLHLWPLRNAQPELPVQFFHCSQH
jgi:hypothetical protein